jgi:hypothetical protein
LTLGSATLLADFSYQQKSTVTGGMMASAMKVAGVFSKQAREPIQTTIAVKGDRLVHRSPAHAQIIDLGSQTITSIDLQKKTYSTMTFQEFKQALEQAQQKMQQKGSAPDMKFKVSANSTGATKAIGGFDARETIIKMEMEGTDQQSGQSGAMVVTTDVWTAPAISGYREIRDFYRRMAEKLDWTPGSNAFMGRPDVAKGMAESMKQVGELEGMPVFEVMSMGATGTSAGQPGAGGQQQQQQQPAQQPSVGGALGSALGGRFGLGRKKQQQPPEQPSSGPTQPAASSGVPNGLVEMTIEMSDFSSAPVDDAQFAIPAGFKRAEPDLRRGMQ